MTSTMGIKLDEETRLRLRALAEKKERTGHWLMKRAIQEYLEREEKYEREKQEDIQRWEQYVESHEAIDHVEMKNRLIRFITDAYEKDNTHG